MWKIKNLKTIANNTILFTADVVDLYPTIPLECALNAITVILLL